ncbi:MAG: hypothetical protein QNJ22_14685 [Desulfosarcinaceae bacterium]|nr:hypothetical protein [Desulfosarcinaceae bacterium]
MAIAIFALLTLAMVLHLVYEHMEINTIKYGILNAIASQSAAVNDALLQLLRSKESPRILNKDYRKLEKVYLSRLNRYLIEHIDADNRTVKKEILMRRDFTL